MRLILLTHGKFFSPACEDSKAVFMENPAVFTSNVTILFYCYRNSKNKSILIL